MSGVHSGIAFVVRIVHREKEGVSHVVWEGCGQFVVRVLSFVKMCHEIICMYTTVNPVRPSRYFMHRQV
jgi:hypothetical protein